MKKNTQTALTYNGRFDFIRNGAERSFCKMGTDAKKEAKEMLALWLEAERAVATGKSYRIGSRQLQRCDMSEIRDAQKYWRNELERAESGRGRGMRVIQGVPRDF